MAIDLATVPTALTQARNSCGAASSTIGGAQQVIAAGVATFAPSDSYIYAKARMLSGQFPYDTGIAAKYACLAMQQFGICPASVWDHDEDVTLVPSEAADTAAAANKIDTFTQLIPAGYSDNAWATPFKATLAANQPVIFGVSPDARFITLPGDNIIRAPLQASLGTAHYLVALQYIAARNTVLVQDSYGPSKGVNGRYEIELPALIYSRVWDAWTVFAKPRVAVSGGNAVNVPAFQAKVAALVVGSITAPLIAEYRAIDALIVPDATGGSVTASFGAQDSTTKGNWKGKYGTRTALIPGVDSPPLPTGASSYVWDSGSSDVRALQKPTGSPRIASTWYADSFTVDVNGSCALYLLDWDHGGRAVKIEVLNPATLGVLATANVSGYDNGIWLPVTASGIVRLKFTRTSGSNATLSAIMQS